MTYLLYWLSSLFDSQLNALFINQNGDLGLDYFHRMRILWSYRLEKRSQILSKCMRFISVALQLATVWLTQQW